MNEIEGKYDYSLITVDYPNNDFCEISTIRLICKSHGIFKTQMFTHLKGVGCPTCEYLDKSNKLERVKRNVKDTEKLNFWKNRTLELMKKFKLSNWYFSWINKKSTYGQCFHNGKIISLSIPYVLACNDVNEIEDTIRHEIGHALTPDDKGHGKEWKAMAKKVGYTPKRCSEFILN
jgi:predicted SprT family Zn-dependent metalloprotease